MSGALLIRLRVAKTRKLTFILEATMSSFAPGADPSAPPETGHSLAGRQPSGVDPQMTRESACAPSLRKISGPEGAIVGSQAAIAAGLLGSAAHAGQQQRR
jgi:hypothetical protein